VYERKDAYHRQARAAGFRSRAAFKVDELVRGMVGRGGYVVDLGCWPGGWLQVCSRLVGEDGLVVGVDLAPVAALGLANVRVIRGNAADPSVIEEVRAILGRPADLVLSDMAPKLTGIRDRDEARSEELVEVALGAARALLRPGGSFVCKLFMSAGYRRSLDEIGASFERVSSKRPAATRRGSAEIYVMARSFRPPVRENLRSS
jgi:23S rRNA (uridine2552-2'-O)-methyltransferase